MQRLCIAFIISFSLTTAGFCQQAAIDSLLHLLPSVKDDRHRIDLLNELSSETYYVEVKQGLHYATLAEQESIDAGYGYGQRRAIILKGFYYHDTGQYKDAFRLYHQALVLDIPADDMLAYGYVMTGNLYRQLANYDSAMLYYNLGLEVLDQVKSERFRAYAYKNIGHLYVLQWRNAEAETYFKKALSLYKNNPGSMADVWYALADVKRNYANYELAEEYLNKGCAIAADLHDEFLRVQCAIYQGELYYNRGAYPAALETLFQALKIMEKKDVPVVLHRIYYAIGDVYEALGQNDISLKYYYESLKIAERLNIRFETANVLSSIAWVYKNQQKFTLAHEYVDRSLLLRTSIGDSHGISNCYNVLGLIYLQEKKYKQSLDYLQQSLAIRKRINHREGISACIFNIALVYEEQGQYEKALTYQFDAMELDETIGNKYSVGLSYNSIGGLFTKLRKFDDARHYLTRAQHMGEQTQSKPMLMTNSLFWSSYYEALGNTEKALQSYKKYAELNDSIYSESSTGRLAELQALYQVEKKDAEIQGLNQQREIQEDKLQLQEIRIHRQNLIIITVAFAVVLISLLAFKTHQFTRTMRTANFAIVEQKEEIQAQSEELTEANQTLTQLNLQLQEKTKQIELQSYELVHTNELITAINRDLDDIVTRRTAQLNEAYKELDTFFYRSSHDFRRPLTTFMGLAEVAYVTVKDKVALDLFDKVRETARALDKMLIKLQSISDVGAQQLVYKEVPFDEIINAIQEDFRDEITQRGIKMYSEVVMHEALVSYPAMIRIMLENLIENSINFCTPANPVIHLRIYQENDWCKIDITDNGQGIAPDYNERIFDMYFRASERSKGNGLGLFIVRKAAHKLNGTITLDPTVKEGSRFVVSLPINYIDMMSGMRLKSDVK